MEKIKIGISSCLLGNEVRYDGGHKRDRYLTGELSEFVHYVPVCPEVECGMTIPREAMQLVGEIENPRLVKNKTREDVTEMMQNWIPVKLKQLENEELCGFIFQKSSPSSGMERIKVYNSKGFPVKKGVGIFARAFMNHFPDLPVEDDGRLHDANIRENFIERIYVEKRWQSVKAEPSRRSLVDFHTRHKYLFMAHSPHKLKILGQITAKVSAVELSKIFNDYYHMMSEVMKVHSTVKKHTNVLQHIAGYFKKQLSADEKKELGEVIKQYYKRLVPLIVPVTLLNHYIRKYNEPYLKNQFYLNPHPHELALRNHV